MKKIELKNGKHITFQTFEMFADEVITNNELTENQVVDFFDFAKESLTIHFNSMIDDGYSAFLFEGIEEVMEEEIKKYLEMSNQQPNFVSQ